MATRTEQREGTRGSIVAAAVAAFSKLGFHRASTREISARAGANQGLITYHFGSKEQLWRAAVEKIFGGLRTALTRLRPEGEDDGPEQAREAIRRYVRFAAAHPELFWLLVEEGKSGDRRMRWLVDTHIKPFYDRFQEQIGHSLSEEERSLEPHAFYALAGAASLMFAVAPECRRLTGLDPKRKQAVEAHADYLARLFIPGPPRSLARQAGRTSPRSEGRVRS